jgi:hypothetical protein
VGNHPGLPGQTSRRRPQPPERRWPKATKRRRIPRFPTIPKTSKRLLLLALLGFFLFVGGGLGTLDALASIEGILGQVARHSTPIARDWPPVGGRSPRDVDLTHGSVDLTHGSRKSDGAENDLDAVPGDGYALRAR